MRSLFEIVVIQITVDLYLKIFIKNISVDLRLGPWLNKPRLDLPSPILSKTVSAIVIVIWLKMTTLLKSMDTKEDTYQVLQKVNITKCHYSITKCHYSLTSVSNSGQMGKLLCTHLFSKGFLLERTLLETLLEHERKLGLSEDAEGMCLMALDERQTMFSQDYFRYTNGWLMAFKNFLSG